MLEKQPDTWEPMRAEVAFEGIGKADGIDEEARRWVENLADEYDRHSAHNSMLKDYYEGNVKVSDYGVTADIENDQTCHWPEKAVDSLAERINLESLAIAGGDAELLADVAKRNNIVTNYNLNIPVKLLYGCMAAAVTKDDDGHARVRFHSAETFTALPSPDFTGGVVAGGLAIARREYTPWSNGRPVPTVVNLYTPGNIGEFKQVGDGEWTYSAGPVPEELPMLYVFAHKPIGTLAPFGKTRITKYVRTLTQDAIRCMWHMQVSGAFYSMAKLYMTGLTDDQFDAVMENKDKYQLSRILAMTTGSDGQPPNIGQLSGNSPQPFIDELMALAKQFSGEASVPLNSLGIVQDNPSSAEAIQASREDICLVAGRDNDTDKPTLERLCKAAMAVEGNTTSDKVDGDILAKFSEPLLNSMSARADWATKVYSVRPGFGETDVAARMMGIDEADLPSIKSDEAAAASNAAVSALFGGGSDADTA